MHPHIWSSETSFQKLLLSFHYMGFGNWTQVVCLGGKYHYLLRHVAEPTGVCFLFYINAHKIFAIFLSSLHCWIIAKYFNLKLPDLLMKWNIINVPSLYSVIATFKTKQGYLSGCPKKYSYQLFQYNSHCFYWWVSTGSDSAHLNT